MKLIASRRMTYATRRLVAGSPFTARSPKHARVLIAARRAKAAPADDAQAITPTPTPAQSSAAGSEIEDLRAEYLKVFDKRPYHGWDAATLTAKIAEGLANG